MDKNDNPNRLLTLFLRELANEIDDGRLNLKQLQHIGEFYMSFLFSEQVEKDNKRSSRRPSRKRQNAGMENKDFMKFISLGYYVYNHILEEKPLPYTQN